MIIKFFLRNPAALVEWPVPDPKAFNFMVMCKMIRADGYFIADSVYIPADSIQCIGMDNAVSLQTAPGTNTQQ